jgi:Domain of unknown function (DUF397)
MDVRDVNRDALEWRVAKRSGGGNCIEVARAHNMIVLRHSRRPDAEMILYSMGEFEAFLDGVKRGEFDDLLRTNA